MSNPTAITGAVNGAAWNAVYWTIGAVGFTPGTRNVSNEVYWGVERPATGTSTGFVHEAANFDPKHPAFQDFLHSAALI